MLTKIWLIPWRPLKPTAIDVLNFHVSLFKKSRSVQYSLFCWMFSEDVCAVWCVLPLNRRIDRRSVNSTFLVTGWGFCRSLSVLSPTEHQHCHKSHWQFSYDRLLSMSDWPRVVDLSCEQLSSWKFFNRDRPCSHLPQAIVPKTFMQDAYLYLGECSVGKSGITHLNKISDTYNWAQTIECVKFVCSRCSPVQNFVRKLTPEFLLESLERERTKLHHVTSVGANDSHFSGYINLWAD